MQAIFTKLIIGFLLLTLIVGTGVTALITTANLNGYTPDDVLLNNDIYNQSSAGRQVVYTAVDASQQSGLDAASQTDIDSAKDSISASDEQLKITTVLQSFFSDLSQLIPIPQFVINIILAIIATIGVAAGIYLFLGRNI